MSEAKGVKGRYKTTNWAAYNAALKARGSLTIWLDKGMQWYAPASGRRGRQHIFSDAAIQFCLSVKCLFGLALRQSLGLVESLLRLACLVMAGTVLLAGCGRSIVFSVCEWGLRKPWLWAPALGAAYWRTTPDIFDSFSWGPVGVRGIARRTVGLDGHAGPGRWNDPDMLLVGNRGQGRSTGVLRTPKQKRRVWRFRGITETEVQTQMTLWSMMAAPLLASHDLARSTEHDAAMLLNPEILAINQDPLGVQAHKHGSTPGLWVLAKPLADGATAVSLTNMTGFSRTATVSLADVGVASPTRITDAWALVDITPVDRLQVRISTRRDFRGAAWKAFRPSLRYRLPAVTRPTRIRVFVQFRDEAGNVSGEQAGWFDTITLRP